MAMESGDEFYIKITFISVSSENEIFLQNGNMS